MQNLRFVWASSGAGLASCGPPYNNFPIIFGWGIGVRRGPAPNERSAREANHIKAKAARKGSNDRTNKQIIRKNQGTTRKKKNKKNEERKEQSKNIKRERIERDIILLKRASRSMLPQFFYKSFFASTFLFFWFVVYFRFIISGSFSFFCIICRSLFFVSFERNFDRILFDFAVMVGRRTFVFCKPSV